MPVLESNNMERILSFVRNLPDSPQNFPQRVLTLFSQYYKCNKSLFFPRLSDPVYMEPHNKRMSLNNFIALNIESYHLKSYTDYYYQKNIFAIKQLSPILQSKKAIRILDIMPFDKYEQTEYYFYLNSTGLYYQACVFIKYKERNIATINLFRSKEAGDFTNEEMQDFNLLSDFISQRYVSALLSTSYQRIMSVFPCQFDRLAIGVMLLDNELMVLQANPAARRLSEMVMEHTTKKNNFFQKSLHYIDGDYASAQTMCNYFGTQILSNDVLSVSALQGGHLQFHGNSLSISDIMGNMKTLHLIFFELIEPASQKLLPESIHTLTGREAEILELVVKGLNNEQIAKQISVSVYTVRTHISNIYKKFNVNSKASLLLKLNQ